MHLANQRTERGPIRGVDSNGPVLRKEKIVVVRPQAAFSNAYVTNLRQGASVIHVSSVIHNRSTLFELDAD